MGRRANSYRAVADRQFMHPFISDRNGGNAKPSVVIATWAGYKKAGPLLISTEHRGTADGGPLHLFFSNVAYKLVGSDKWMDAEVAQ